MYKPLLNLSIVLALTLMNVLEELLSFGNNNERKLKYFGTPVIFLIFEQRGET